jgi:GT2 family glycosyltransferase
MSNRPIDESAAAAAERVCAVIVTYNRLELLQRCLASVRAQSRPVDLIVVVDNGSTDDTASWLAENFADSTAGRLVVRQPNLGSAGGFHTGLSAGFASGCDWFWSMDDDTIPDHDCIEQMLTAAGRWKRRSAEPIGWLCSVVRWTDGSLHRMNEPKLDSFLSWGGNVLDQRTLTARWCSFVSVTVSRAAIERCGLPLKEAFIWYDDVEYTARIRMAGLAGLVALDSGAEHRTKANYTPDFADITAATFPRFRHAFRNEVVFMKTVEGGSKARIWFCFMRLMLRRIRLMLAAGKARYLGVALLDGWRGLISKGRVDFPSGSRADSPPPTHLNLSSSNPTILPNPTL